MISDDGNCQPAIQMRIQKAQSAFFAHLDELTDKSYPLYVRYQNYMKHVRPVMLWGCAGWTWMLGNFTTIFRFESGMLRKVFHSQ